MKEFFSVGDKIYGYCNGYFGADYDNKICIMVTDKYAVFQYTEGNNEGDAVVLNEPFRLYEDLVQEWKRIR
jgi:hypothetical protein